MPAITIAPNALTTVERALAHLGEGPDANGKNTDRLQFLINGYSTAIDRYTGRQFKPDENGVEKLFAYTGNGFLSLAPYEARAVTTVTINTDLPTNAWRVLANQDAVTESEWRPNPRNKTREGTYTHLDLIEVGQYSFLLPEPFFNRRNRGHQVTVLGDWGIGSVPADVELACLIAVANGYRNPEDFASRALGPLSFSEETGSGDEGMSLPRASRALLFTFKRKGLR